MNFPIQSDYIEKTKYDDVYHDHQTIEFIYCLYGETSYLINGQPILLKKGTALFINSHVLHARQASPAHLMIISIKKETFSMHPSVLNYFDSIFEQNHASFMKIHNPQILLLITRLYGLLNREEWNPFSILSTASNLVDKISQALPIQEPLQDYDQLLVMIHYLETHLSHKITLQDLADETSICRSRCCSLFQNYLHLTPMAYLNDLRLVKSASLLSTNQSIVSIAHQCGFTHPSYYNTQFKKRYHMTPLTYRHSL